MFCFTSSRIRDGQNDLNMSIRSDFTELNQALVAQGSDMHPSELHGMLIGYLCAAKDTTPGKLQALFVNWLDGQPSKKLQEILDLAYSSAAEEFDDYSDFAFRLMLPSDDEAIQARSASLSAWCSGFLSGFGEEWLSDDGMKTTIKSQRKAS